MGSPVPALRVVQLLQGSSNSEGCSRDGSRDCRSGIGELLGDEFSTGFRVMFAIYSLAVKHFFDSKNNGLRFL